MSNQIKIEGSGEDSLNRLTSAVERLEQALLSLTSTNNPLAQMQAQMRTGFAELSELVKQGGAGITRAVRENGDATAEAVEAAGYKIKQADARTWEQIQKGSAANVAKAFNQLAQGIPVEAVRERMGELATATAAGLNGDLAALKQFQANAESLWELHYSRLAGATEAQMAQALEMDKAFDARRLAQRVTATAKLSEASAAASWQNHLDLDKQKTAATEAAAAAALALEEKSAAASWQNYLALDAKKTAADEARAAAQLRLDEKSAAATWQNYLDLEAKKVAALEAEASRLHMLDEQSAARSWQTFLDLEAKKVSAEEARYARQMSLDEAAAAASWRNFLDLEAKKVSASERDAALNVNYRVASPVGRAQIQMRAVAADAEGLDPAALVGTKAAADAAGKSLAELQAVMNTTRGTTRALAVDTDLLNDSLRQAEGAFRGAAHQAGIFGLHHGQLLAMLAGAGVAAALHHIAETGAEVEYELANLNALSGQMQPIDIDKFVGITSGTLTNVKEAAAGMAALAEAGMNQQQAMAALPDIMRLATLGNMTVAQSAEMAVESMHAFGKTSADIGNIGDILVAVGSKSNVSVHKLAEDMKSAATTGQLFNLSMEEITATVGALAERGLTIQPLSSALNKLYEPSAKTAAVMKEWDLTVKDGARGLKNYTEFMGELAAKVGEFKVPADALKQLGMSAQSIKAMEVMTQHLDDYTHLLHEAEHAGGKMFDAMLVKEDTAEGAFLRLSSTVQGVFTEAFKEASPAVQALEQSLLRLAGSQSTVEMFKQFALGMANLTADLFEHAGAIGAVVAGYVGLRIIASVISSVQAAAVAYQAATAASVAKAAADQAEIARLALLTVEQRAAAIAARDLAAASVLAGEGMGVAAAGVRALSTALGLIGLLITAAAVAYEMFGHKVSEAEQLRVKNNNSIETTIDGYEREIARLKEMEEQLIRTGKAGKETAGIMALLHAEDAIQAAEEKMKKAAAAPVADSSLRMGARQAPGARNGQQMYDDNYNAANAELNDAIATRDRLKAVVDEEAELSLRVGKIRTVTELQNKLKSLPTTVVPVVNSPAAAAAAKDANERLAALRKESFDVLDNAAATDHLTAAKNSLEIVEKDILATKRDAAALPKEDKKGINDALKAELDSLQLKIELQKMLAKSDIDTLKQQNRRGEIGDLVMINAQLKDKLATDQMAVAVAKQQYDAVKASDKEPKAAALQKYEGTKAKAQMQAVIDERAAGEQRLTMQDQWDQEELQQTAATLTEKGQLVQAYLVDYELKYRKTINKITNDMLNSGDDAFKAAARRRLDTLAERQDSGVNDAKGKQSKNQFEAAFATIESKLVTIQSQSGPGSGLAAIFDNALLSEKAFADALPGLMAKQKELQDLADGPGGTDVQKKDASAEMKRIEQAALKTRSVWVSVGKEIEDALTKAFGNPGKALGALITRSIAYGDTQKQIKDKLAKDSVGADPEKLAELQKKASKDSASAQISAYADMAGAAKGFFDEQSGAYATLAKVEKAFHLAQLAMTLDSMLLRLFATTTVTTAKVAAAGIEGAAAVATVPVVVGAEAAKSSAYGVTALASALAAPFPANIAAFAVVAAMLAAIGVAAHGGGSPSVSVSEQRQKDNGTGTVFGDSKAKSDSINKSLDLVSKNTFDGLLVSYDMLASLRSIQTSMSGLGNLLIRGSNLTGDMAPGSKGAAYNLAGTGVTGLAIMGVLGGVVGIALDKLLGGKISNIVGNIANTVFGGKVTSLDTGLTFGKTSVGAAAAGGISASQYNDTKKDGGLFRGDKYSTSLTGLGTEANQQISKVIKGMSDAIRQAGGLMGMEGDAFNNRLNGFIVDIGKISLKGMTGDEIQKALESAFSKLGDDMAKFALGGLEQFQQVGEGYLETVVRLATSYQAVDTVFLSLGKTFGQVGIGSMEARQRLIDLAGGLDNFTSQGEAFLKNFYTAAEQADKLKARIAPTLAKYGLSTEGPDASKKFRDFVMSIDATTAAGAAAYTELMNVQGAFKTITESIGAMSSETKDLQDQLDELTMTRAELVAKERAALEPANRALYDQLQQQKRLASAKEDLADAYDREVSSITAANDRLKTLGTTLRDFAKQLMTGANSPLSAAAKYDLTKNQFQSTLAKAKDGDTKAQDNLQTAAEAFLEASKVTNASGAGYTSDFQLVTGAISNMADWTDQQVDIGTASLDALKAQISGLTEIKDAVLTLPEALKNLLTLQNGGPGADIMAQITDVYKQLLGKAPDAATLSRLTDSVRYSGKTVASIATDIRNSDAYTTNHQPSAYTYTGAGNSADALEKMADQIADLNAQIAAYRRELPAHFGYMADAYRQASSESADQISQAQLDAARAQIYAQQTGVNIE